MNRRTAAKWLIGLIVLSVSIRFLLAQLYPALWILDDEIISVELARAIAGAPEDQVRGVGGASFYFLYAALISPAFALFSEPNFSYLAIKLINCVVMSLVAIPTYLLARRVLERGLALVAVLMTLVVPSMVYTASAMTENAFYPAFLWCAFAMVRVLERPSLGRQLSVVGAIAIACLVRNQAVALVPALVLVLFSRAFFSVPGIEGQASGSNKVSLWKRLGAYRLIWMILAAPVLVFLVAWVADAEAVEILAGQNQFIFGMSDETLAGFLPRLPATFFSHLAVLNLYVGVLPFVAFLILAVNAFRKKSADEPLRDFTWVALWVTLCNVLMVAAFLALVGQTRIADRNLFFVAPFFFIALCRWIASVNQRERWIWLPCAIAAGLPLLFDYSFIDRTINFADGLVLVAISKVQFLMGIGDAFEWLLLAATIVASSAMLLPRRVLRFAPALVILYLAAISLPVVRATSTASMVALSRGTVDGSSSWIDESVEAGARVDVVWPGSGSKHPFWQGAFFNRATSRTFGFYGCEHGEHRGNNSRNRGMDRLAMDQLVIEESTGLLLDEQFEPIQFDHILTSAGLELDADVIRSDSSQGVLLYDVGGNARVVSNRAGVAKDGWTQSKFSYTIYNSPKGTLAVELGLGGRGKSKRSGEHRTLLARINGEVLQRVEVAPNDFKTLLVPYPESFSKCTKIDFEVHLPKGATEANDSSGTRWIVCRKFKRIDQATNVEVVLSDVYPDGWSFPQFDVLFENRVRGRLSQSFWAGASREDTPQRVVGTLDQVEVVNALLNPGTQTWCDIPLRSDSNSSSVVHFTVEPPFMPNPDADTRTLGLFPGTFIFTSPGQIESELEGVHHDYWTAPKFSYAVRSSLPGEVTVYLESNDKLYAEGQTVVARIGGREVMRSFVGAGEELSSSFAITENDIGLVKIEFEVTPNSTTTPDARSKDPRELGILLRGTSFVATDSDLR